MAAVRDSLASLGSFQIPRPKCVGMEFVTVRGSRSGFYRSINRSVALKYGLVQQRQAGRRPTIPEGWVALGAGIPEEPEAEPTPDYEEKGNGQGKGGEERPAEQIAMPSGKAPPAPPLPPQLRQSLILQRQRNQSALHLNQLTPPAGKKKCRFELTLKDGGKNKQTGNADEMASIRL